MKDKDKEKKRKGETRGKGGKKGGDPNPNSQRKCKHRGSWGTFSLDTPYQAYVAEGAVVNFRIHAQNIHNVSYCLFLSLHACL